MSKGGGVTDRVVLAVTVCVFHPAPVIRSVAGRTPVTFVEALDPAPALAIKFAGMGTDVMRLGGDAAGGL